MDLRYIIEIIGKNKHSFTLNHKVNSILNQYHKYSHAYISDTHISDTHTIDTLLPLTHQLPS